jgi:hypothetical protein
MKWGYRCERLDLVGSGEAVAGVSSSGRLGSVVEAILHLFRYRARGEGSS